MLLNLKIYKSNSAKTIEKASIVEQLLANELDLHEKMVNLCNNLRALKLTPNGENELIKHLFYSLDGEVYFPRKGDNSERFDALIGFKDYKAVVEVEIPSTEILDAPRNLLDDYAVINCRKKLSDEVIVPLVICWDLPNKRSDYWNVISDINELLELKIKTVSILSLALHYWTKSPVDLINDNYYLNHDCSTVKCENDVLNKYGMSIDDFPGYFTPYK